MYAIIAEWIEWVPLAAVLVSLIAVIPILITGPRFPNLRESWTIIAALIKFGLVLLLVPYAWAGEAVEIQLIEISPALQLTLRADPFGVYFAIIASGLWIFTSFYSIGYVRGAREGKQSRYFASFAASLSATIGIAFAGNLFTFLIFYEMLTLATWPLVIHKETPKAIRAGRQYLAYTLSAGLALIAATGLTLYIAGSTEFVPGGLLQHHEMSQPIAVVLILLFIGSVGVKAGIMPLHSWLPTAMAAPTPVSALLHAVAVVKSGAFGVYRAVGYIIGPEQMQTHGLDIILFTFAGVTILLASFIALNQNNLKRRLAYSTVGHLSYIVLGASMISHTAYLGGMMHIAAHATMKITLFFCAGAIYVSLHRENISDLDGIGRVMPWTMGAFTVGALGLAGVPPINGFYSKWLLANGALESGFWFGLVILMLSGLLNAAYLMPIVVRAFFRPGKGLEGHGEAPKTMVVPLTITAILSVLFGLYPDLFFKFLHIAELITSDVMGGI